MQISVAQPADFYRILDPAYDRFVQQNTSDSTFEVILEATEYRDENIKLIDLHDTGRADVNVHASEQRTWLSGGYIQISGGSIELEGVTLDNFQSSYPSLLLTARNVIRLSKCAFTRLTHLPDYAGEALMRIRPGFSDDTSAHLHIDSCVWMDNRQAKDGSLLSLTDQHRHWSSVVIENSVFMGNQAAQGIILEAGDVTLRNCFLHTFPSFLVMNSPHTRLTIEGCVCVGEEDFVTDLWADEDDLPDRITPETLALLADDAPERITLRDNRYYPPEAAANIKLADWLDQVQRGVFPTVDDLVHALQKN